MDEQQVRALVRQAIARHMGPGGGAVGSTPSAAPSGSPPDVPTYAPPADGGAGISAARFHLVRAAGEVECLIEPAVACTHCGYCQCYGH